jgi:ABC-2 type transport system ATP-binding protein
MNTTHAPSTNPAPFSLNSCNKAFKQRQVLADLSWAPPATGEHGAVIGLLGRNGAGKSTLIECLLGLAPLDSGSAAIFGEPVERMSDATRAKLGYVPQNAAAFEWLTAPQMLAYHQAFYPNWHADKVESLLTRWSIDRSIPIGRLSGGEQQRLAIIRALAHEPSLLVLDEPAASLDPAGRRDFLREVIGMCERTACTVLFSTHIFTDLERIAVDVALLHNGNIAMQLPLDTLSEQAHSVHGPEDQLTLLTQRHGIAWQARKPGVALGLLDDAGLASVRMLGLTAARLGLEDYFIEVTQ